MGHMTLGELIKAAPTGKLEETPDFFLTKAGKPTRDKCKAVIEIKITSTDTLLPDYAFYAMFHLYYEGLWANRAVTVENLLAVPVQSTR